MASNIIVITDQNLPYFLTQLGLTPPTTLRKPSNIILTGNSNMSGYMEGDPNGAFRSNGFPQKVLAHYNAEEAAFLGYPVMGNKVYNGAHPGKRWQELIGYQQDGSEYAGYDPNFDNLVVTMEDGNSRSGTLFQNGVAENWIGPEQILTLARQYHNNWNTRYPGIKQVGSTDEPRSNRPYNPTAPFDQEVLRQKGNRLKREAFANGTLNVTAFVDYGGNGPMGAPYASENLYGNFFLPDGTHFTEEGADHKAKLTAYGLLKAKYPDYVQPPLLPIPNVIKTAGTREEDDSSRIRSKADWQLAVASADFSQGKVNINQGGDDGSVWFQFVTTLTSGYYAPLSDNGGDVDILVNGELVATKSTLQATLERDVLIYQIPVPAYTPYADGAFTVRIHKRSGNVFFEDDTRHG